MPQALLDAVIQQESGGQHIDPATGGMVTNKRTGARGVAQIMPGTGASPGFGVRPRQNDSEAEHRRFASDYLAAMLERYDGDRRKALAAYNAGPGRVDALIAKHGDAWLSHAPKETRDYVPSVLANADGYDMPVPTGVKPGGDSSSGGQPHRVALEGTFRLESPRGESVAAPVEVRKSISIPRPYGAPA